MTSIDTLKAFARIRAMAASGEARRIREASHVSLTEMSGAIPAGVATLARWETGERKPRGKAALRWLEILTELQPTELADAG